MDNNEQIKKFFQNQTTQKIEEEPEDELQVICFIIGSEEFAVPISSVQEIVKPVEYTRVPGAPEYVLGVMSLRGIILPLIDLRMKFGLKPLKPNKDIRYIVIKTSDDEIAGFVIDKLTEAVRIKEADIEPTPETLNEEADIVYGIGKQKDRLITILKVEYLLKRAF